jgi:hypothetical protein
MVRFIQDIISSMMEDGASLEARHKAHLDKVRISIRRETTIAGRQPKAVVDCNGAFTSVGELVISTSTCGSTASNQAVVDCQK